MRTTKGLTLRDQNFINSTCRHIYKLENYGVSESELRQRVYMLGLFTFRQFHKAGTPEDFRSPRIVSKELVAN